MKTKRALLDHELWHCQKGEPDEQGNPTWYILDHDLHESNGVVRCHGLWMGDLQNFAKAVEDNKHIQTTMSKGEGLKIAK